MSSLGPVPFFPDAATSRFIPEIIWLAEAGVITGCAPGFYCPNDVIRREQMAAFMDRALDLPGTTEDFFDDDDGRPLEGAINRVAAAGIVTGCADRAFCPTGRVIRAEIAAFLVLGASSSRRAMSTGSPTTTASRSRTPSVRCGPQPASRRAAGPATRRGSARPIPSSVTRWPASCIER